MKGTGRPERAVGFRSSQACGSLYELLGGDVLGASPGAATEGDPLWATLWVPACQPLGACRPHSGCLSASLQGPAARVRPRFPLWWP